MIVTREEMKQEAVDRLRMIGIYPETRKQFEREGLVSICEPPLGACFWLDAEQVERVKEFEERVHCLVYLAVKSYGYFGEMECYLYVYEDNEEWKYDRQDIREGQAIAYCYNKSMPDCSESGAIGIKLTPAGGIERTW